ncbi:MAG: GNAT family N-acetyltransferase [Chitinophagaceae bacterium]|nr:GNAT family N-acetyltransferase [Chitinophagaceae bacterium]
MPVTIASLEDTPALTALINSAYRGEASKKGWTTEADIIEGSLRTDEWNIKELMLQPDTIFLKYRNEKSEIEGCVFLQKKEGKLYLGMLSVSPAEQAKGTGKQLMIAAEDYALQLECPAIFMRVISIRYELIAWYERQGYQKTGETEPFPTDNPFGIPKHPLEFLILEKSI